MPDPIKVPQKDSAWVRQATPQAIHEALQRNELAVLLGGTAPIDVEAMAHANAAPVEHEDTNQISRDALKTMAPDAVIKAHAAGLLDDVLGTKTTTTKGDNHA